MKTEENKVYLKLRDPEFVGDYLEQVIKDFTEDTQLRENLEKFCKTKIQPGLERVLIELRNDKLFNQAMMHELMSDYHYDGEISPNGFDPLRVIRHIKTQLSRNKNTIEKLQKHKKYLIEGVRKQNQARLILNATIEALKEQNKELLKGGQDENSVN